MEKNTISVCFVEPVVRALRDRGHDAEALLERASIGAETLANPQARVAPPAYAALMRLAAEALDDEFFGQDSRRMKVGSFAMLCQTAIHCRTLDDALITTLRFFNLVLDDLVGELSSGPGATRIVLRCHRPEAAPRLFAHETLLVFIHRLACWLVNRRLPIFSAAFCYPEPPHSAEYRVLYSSQLQFAAPQTMIEFGASHLILPVVRDEEALREFLRIAPENLLVQYKDRSGQTSSVRELLRRLPPAEWPSLTDTARAVNVSVPTLRRRLEAEGQSFRQIKDQLRRELAVGHLRDPHQNVAEIAAELGFAETSAFHRAFKKWTGVGPGQYRRTLERQPGL